RAGRTLLRGLDHLGRGRTGGEENLVDCFSRCLHAGEWTARARYQFSAQLRRDRGGGKKGGSVAARTTSFGLEGQRERPTLGAGEMHRATIKISRKLTPRRRPIPPGARSKCRAATKS